MTAWLTVILISLSALALAAFGGYRLARRRMRRVVEESGDRAAELITMWRRNETVAGAYSLAAPTLALDRPAAMLAGVENCYYTPPDFEHVTWVPRDIPTPFVGFAPAPGRLASAVINAAQFRYARELDAQKSQGVCRIFLTGASAAFGCGASSNETTIGGYLEKHLNEALGDHRRCEVVTAAACAWTTAHERILIENRLAELEPDIVISFSGFNDAFWSISGRNTHWLRVFQDEYFLTLANAALAANAAPAFPPSDADTDGPVSLAHATERLVRNVALARHALAAVGAEYVFALQPTMETSRKVLTAREQAVAARVASDAWFKQAPSFYQEFRKRLHAIEQPGFRFIDTTGVFDACGNGVDIFIDTCHFGDRGNDLIARLLNRCILPMVRERFGDAVPQAARSAGYHSG
jgi:lysophospholipase L1-like esterase